MRFDGCMSSREARCPAPGGVVIRRTAATPPSVMILEPSTVSRRDGRKPTTSSTSCCLARHTARQGCNRRDRTVVAHHGRRTGVHTNPLALPIDGEKAPLPCIRQRATTSTTAPIPRTAKWFSSDKTPVWRWKIPDITECNESLQPKMPPRRMIRPEEHDRRPSPLRLTRPVVRMYGSILNQAKGTVKNRRASSDGLLQGGYGGRTNADGREWTSLA